MKVSNCMTRDVTVCAPDDSICKVAVAMAKLDCGVIPIGENNKLVGVVTDRDIAIRGVAQGMGPDTPARELMSDEVLYSFEDQDLDEVSANMASLKVRRLPVVDRDKNLVGILSLGDIALNNGKAGIGAFEAISQPGAPHSQSM